MIVVAIIGVMVSLSFTTVRALGSRSAAQNGAHDLGAALSRARALAQARGHDVWVIVYPELKRDKTATGPGAFFVYSDPDMTFNTSGGTPSELKYSAFTPAVPDTAPGKGSLVESVYLDDYAGDSVKFGAPPSTALFKAPFVSLNPVSNNCSFCSSAPGGGTRGAIVFDANGSARFVNGSGVVSSARMARLSVINPDTALRQFYLFGISAGTGYVGTQRP